MLSILGFLLLVAAGIGFYFNMEYNKTVKYNSNSDDYKRELPFRMPGKWWFYAVLGIFMFFANGAFFWADATQQYFLVYPTGQTGVVTTQGIKFQGWAKITVWPKYIDVKVVTKDENGDYEVDVNDIEGVMSPIPIRFIDQVTARVEISTRFQLPSDPESFKALAIKFRSIDNLVNNTLIPTVKEQVSNTGYMFKAQDYISGEAQNFRQTLDEQLKYGAFKIEKITNHDTIYSDSASRAIKEIKTSYEVNKVQDHNGHPIIIPHEITENKIKVSQVIIDEVALAPAFKERLKKQRDESAKRQLEQQRTSTAKDSQQRIIAEGERDKAAKRVEEEKKQVGVLIAIETELKQEETNKKLATIQLQTQRINSEKKIVKAKAEAAEIKLKVSAGITPEVRLQMELNAKIAVAAEIAKLKLPATYITNGGSKAGGNSSILMDLLGADYAKKMLGGK